MNYERITIEWLIKNAVDLAGANLFGANLSGADLDNIKYDEETRGLPG